MKKVLLVVALLLLATPVFAADVTITATKVGGFNTSEPNHLQKVAIGYTATAADAIRGFALELKTDVGNIDHIADFNKGECNVPGKGYGIFPGKFRDVIYAADPNWQDTAYNPIAPAGDLNGAGGQDQPRMVVELGTIYQDPNYPGISGTLFTVDVNMEGKTQVTLTVAADATRGGIVKKDATAGTSNLPITLVITEASGPYTISGKVTGAVAPKLNGIGGVNMNGVLTDGLGNYSFTVAGGSSGTCTPTDANGQWTFVPASFSWTNISGNMVQNVVGTALATECVNKRDPGYANWVTLGRRDCWCYKKQANGDTDGKATLGKYVVAADLTTFLNGYNKTVTQLLALVPTQPNNICADFDHKATLSKPVVAADLTIFLTWYNKTGVPDGSGATINAWKN